jgi:hypothetical protein
MRSSLSIDVIESCLADIFLFRGVCVRPCVRLLCLSVDEEARTKQQPKCGVGKGTPLSNKSIGARISECMEAVCTNLFGLFCLRFLSGHTDTTKKYVITWFRQRVRFSLFFFSRRRRRFVFAEIRGGERESIVCVCVFGFVVAFFTYPHERKVSDKRRASSVEPTFLLDSVRLGFSLLQRPRPSPLSFFFFFSPLLFLGRLPDFHLHYLCFVFVFSRSC